MLLTATWGVVVFVNLHGIDEGLQSGGIFFIETFGTFLFAKAIRSTYLCFPAHGEVPDANGPLPSPLRCIRERHRLADLD